MYEYKLLHDSVYEITLHAEQGDLTFEMAIPDASLIEEACENLADIHVRKIETKAEADQKAFYAATQYQRARAAEYPSMGEQLDYIYHNGVDAWKTDIVDPIKAKYPKPE